MDVQLGGHAGSMRSRNVRSSMAPDGSLQGGAWWPRLRLLRFRARNRGGIVTPWQWWALDALAFAAILIAGIARLPQTFFGDQALNMLMGQLIAQGGSPYVDLWDLKHPGIFFFFAVGGALFGFNELGIHLFELLWMAALAVAVRIAAGQLLFNRVAIALAPLLTVGVYYALTTSYHQTQTEAVIGLPLLVSLIAAVAAVRARGRRPRAAWLIASGFSAGIVSLFKAPYIAVPVLFWALAVGEWRRTQYVGTRSAIRTLVPALVAGVILPVGAAVVYLASVDALKAAWWTFVVHPGEAAQREGVHPQRFVDALTWFVRTFRVPLILAFVGGWDRFRRGWDLVPAALVAWLLGGLLVIWVQIISWWPYHYLSLLVPVGLLAASGIETLWRAVVRATRLPTRALAIGSLLVLSALFVRQLDPVKDVVGHAVRASQLPGDARALLVYQAARNPHRAALLEATSFLREPTSHPGPIYVFGHPVLYHLAGRQPAVPILVWGTSPPAGTWGRLMRELEAAAPPYVLVHEEYLRPMTGHNPTMVREGALRVRSHLADMYVELSTGESGTWYVRRDLAGQPPAR